MGLALPPTHLAAGASHRVPVLHIYDHTSCPMVRRGVVLLFFCDFGGTLGILTRKKGTAEKGFKLMNSESLSKRNDWVDGKRREEDGKPG